MLHSILTLIFRSLVRNFYYSVITLSSLVVGISAAVFIFLWVNYEVGYDAQNPDADRVFVVLTNETVDGDVVTQEETYAPLADLLTSEVPEVESMTRIDNTTEKLTVGAVALDKQGVYADSTFFNIFNADFKEGLTLSPLPGKHSIAISDKLASMLFPNTDALGKVIAVGTKGEFKVTSVFHQYAENNSLNYIHFVLPYNTIQRQPEDWQGYYVKLNRAESKLAVEKQIDKKFSAFYQNNNNKAFLFALKDWRLRWHFENGKATGGRIVYVYIFSITGIFILLMACVNYMNITTARATKRAREIGIRKVTGATQTALIKQFLSESLLFASMAAIISAGTVYLLLPFFCKLTDLPLQFSLTDPSMLTGLSLITIFCGLVGGSYPAFLLSGFRPVVVLNGQAYSTLTGGGVRRALVVFQFGLSTAMIFAAMVMWQQTDFLLTRDVGYDKHNVINVWLAGDSKLPLEQFKHEIANHTSVVSVAYGGASPMEVNGYSEVKWPGANPAHPTFFYGASVDFDMVTTLGFKLLQGRNYASDRLTDSSNFIINKKAADILGFDNPVGQRITYTMFGEQQGEIIGVIDDFNNDDIHLPAAPVIFCIGKPGTLSNMFIRYRDGQLNAALDNLRKTFKRFEPTGSLHYSFLDNDYETQLQRELFLRKLSMTFTIIAILIASLGLLGVTIFNAARRTKEIGIRRVLGATVSQVMVLLYKEFLKPVLISLLVALPVGYWLMAKYLEGFVYRISISVFSFLFVITGMIVLTLVIVSYQSYLAAVKNPVDSLKVE